MVVKNLSTRIFNATVLSDIDTDNQGRYRVHIPDLEPLLTIDKGIWVKNHVHKYRDTTGTGFRYGQYLPIRPGTRVLVRFYYPNDINSGYIDRILDDDIPDPNDNPLYRKYKSILPFNAKKEDRDELYQLIRTPKFDCLFLITEDTKSENIPPHSMHLYYKKGESLLIFDEFGLHFKTIRNEYHTISEDLAIKVDKNYFHETRQNVQIRSGGEYRHSIQYDYYLRSTKGNVLLEADNNAIFLISPSEQGACHTVATKYASISSPKGFVVITGKQAIRECSDDEISTTAKSSNKVIAGSQSLIVGVSSVKLLSDGVITLDAPSVHISGRLTVGGGASTAASGIFKQYYKPLDPIAISNIEDNFFQDYELSNYSKLPDSGVEEELSMKQCRDILRKAFKSTHIPEIEGLNIDVNGNKVSKYFSKFKYAEETYQQVQNPEADNLYNVRALVAQRSYPPEPNTVKFEGSELETGGLYISSQLPRTEGR